MFLKLFNRKHILSWKTKPLLLTAFALLSWLGMANSAFAFFRFALLYSVENGSVELRRSGWSEATRIYPFTFLYDDDRLTVSTGANVVLFCSTGSFRNWTRTSEANVGSTCFDLPRWERPSFGVSEVWSAADPTVPYVISPWSGQVLTSQPELRWNAVEGAEQYTVTLRRRVGEDWADVWTVTTDETAICYPEGQPELAVGEEYALSVSVDDGPIVQMQDTAVFSLMGGEEAQAARAAISSIEELDIDQTAKTLLLAEKAYSQFKLFSQGINELTQLVNSGEETAQVHRLLGDYYIRVGLQLPAEESYAKAIELAEANENLQENILAAWGLGTVYGRVGRKAQARIYLQEAKLLTHQVDDTETAASIDAELSRISSD